MPINLAFAEPLAIMNALKEYLNLIEEQTERSLTSGKCELEDPSWNPFFVPYTMRGVFLIAMWAAYEHAVCHTAYLIEKQQGHQGSFSDIRGGPDFPKTARKYYKCKFPFDLAPNERCWQKLLLLYALRNAMAHANGDLELVRRSPFKKQRKRIMKAINTEGVGVNERYGFIIVSGDFLRCTFKIVKDEVSGLMDRYTQWDKDNRASQQGQEV